MINKFFKSSLNFYESAKDFLIGKWLDFKGDSESQKLRKTTALAVFSSDALSSTAYATEAILLVLVAGAGLAGAGLALPIAIAIAVLIGIVGFSYFQTVHEYPNGGGAYSVSRENLGKKWSLLAAASLLVDYVLTVAVSVSAGVAAIVSAFPEFADGKVAIAVGIVVFMTWINLRGVKESAGFFAIPTYAFIASAFLLIGAGVWKYFSGGIVRLPSPEVALAVSAPVTFFLILRAFSAGCTALTGIEAISNGVPSFKAPEGKNAGRTLLAMIAILGAIFIGITFLAVKYGAYSSEETHETVLSQIGSAVFGGKSPLFYLLQLTTMLILSVAANTAYAGFPRLASIIAKDGHLPKMFSSLGRRLVYSRGIIFLGTLSCILIILFNAKEQRILPLYAVGVFLSFTLSQAGMVVHWIRKRQAMKMSERGRFIETLKFYFHIGVNGLGAIATAGVFSIVLFTKFADGAWIVFIAIPSLVGLFILAKRNLRQEFA